MTPRPADAEGMNQLVPEFGSEAADRLVYERWVELTNQSKHGSRWQGLRSFEDDPLGLFDLRKSFFPVRDNGVNAEATIAAFVDNLTTRESFNAFSRAVGEVLQRDDVRAHRENGGTIVIDDIFHNSYAGEALGTGAAVQAEPEIAPDQTAVLSRGVGLYIAHGLKVVDDGLLQVSNILQTFPDSPSGMDPVFDPYRRPSNKLALREYLRLLQAGGQVIWLAASASEAMPDQATGKLVVGRVSSGSAALLRRGNVKTIPAAIDCNPFQSDGGTVAQEMTFAFGEAQSLDSEEAVHAMTERGVALINEIKKADTPDVVYETPDAYELRMGKAA